MADVDKDDKLSKQEFAIAMHIIMRVKKNLNILPTLLPFELEPKSTVVSDTSNSEEKDIFDDIMGQGSQSEPKPSTYGNSTTSTLNKKPASKVPSNVTSGQGGMFGIPDVMPQIKKQLSVDRNIETRMQREAVDAKKAEEKRQQMIAEHEEKVRQHNALVRKEQEQIAKRQEEERKKGRRATGRDTKTSR